MGDRGTITVKDFATPGVTLYTHLGAYRLLEDLARALDSQEGRARANDTAYLTRIIFDHIRRPLTDSPELSYGIMPEQSDTDSRIHAVVTVTGTDQPASQPGLSIDVTFRYENNRTETFRAEGFVGYYLPHAGELTVEEKAWGHRQGGHDGKQSNQAPTEEEATKDATPSLGPCNCRPGIARDNCPTCEGTGHRVDFAALRQRPTIEKEKPFDFSGVDFYPIDPGEDNTARLIATLRAALAPKS